MTRPGLQAGLVLLLVLLTAQLAQAHRFAPSQFKVTDTSPQQYKVVRKTTVQGNSDVQIGRANF